MYSGLWAISQALWTVLTIAHQLRQYRFSDPVFISAGPYDEEYRTNPPKPHLHGVNRGYHACHIRRNDTMAAAFSGISEFN